jgi:hypothetical protein
MTGAAGPVGATGLQGPAGLAGPAGKDGVDGKDGATGAAGAVGATGLQGPAGLAGPAGKDGVDGKDGMTGAAGPVGATGAAGTTGQTATTLTSTGFALLSVIDGGPTPIPGLTGQLTTTANSVVVFTSNGGIVNTGILGDHVRVDVTLIVDGRPLEVGSYDLENGNFSNTGRWSFSIATTLLPGVHIVAVNAQLTDIHKASASPTFPRALVGAAANASTHGTLTAVVLKQ